MDSEKEFELLMRKHLKIYTKNKTEYGEINYIRLMKFTWKEAQKAAYTKIEDMFANEKSLDDIWRSTTDLKEELK